MQSLDSPDYIFAGSATTIKLPETITYRYMQYNDSNYDYRSSSGEPLPVYFLEGTLINLQGTAFVLFNKTGASGQELVFTMSKCIADGNPMGFCKRLNSSSSALYVACVLFFSSAARYSVRGRCIKLRCKAIML